MRSSLCASCASGSSHVGCVKRKVLLLHNNSTSSPRHTVTTMDTLTANRATPSTTSSCLPHPGTTAIRPPWASRRCQHPGHPHQTPRQHPQPHSWVLQWTQQTHPWAVIRVQSVPRTLFFPSPLPFHLPLPLRLLVAPPTLSLCTCSPRASWTWRRPPRAPSAPSRG